MINAISKLNVRNKELSIAAYDLSTLNTIIPRNKLKKLRHEPLNNCFKRGEKQFTVAAKYGAQWTDDKNKVRATFNKSSLEVAINFLLDNCLFIFVNLSFWQINNISMGSEAATVMADLFLY